MSSTYFTALPISTLNPSTAISASDTTTYEAFSATVQTSAATLVPRGCRTSYGKVVHSNKTTEIMEMVIYCVLMPILTVGGLFANSVTAAVFYKLGLKKGINLCLFLLALSDLFFLLTKTLTRMSKVMLILSYGDSEGKSRFYFAMAGYHLIRKSELFMYYSYFLTTVASLERCVSIVRPFKAGRIFIHRAVVLILVLGFLVVLTLFVLFGFRNQPQCVYRPHTGQLLWAVAVTKLYVENKEMFNVIYDLVIVFVFPVVSLTVVLGSTYIIIRQLSKAAKWRHSTSGGRGSSDEAGVVVSPTELQLYKVLVSLSVVHVICTAPTLFKDFGKLVSAEFQQSGEYSNVYLTVIAVKDLTSVINSAVNIVVYFSHSSQFRTTLRSLLSSCKIPCHPSTCSTAP